MRADKLQQSLDPGNLKTDLYRSMPWWQMLVISRVLKEPVFGAYTELYGGLSPDITMEHNGTFGKYMSTLEDIIYTDSIFSCALGQDAKS